MAADTPQGEATVDFELKLGDHLLKAKVSVPAGPTRMAELLPILHSFANAIVDAGVRDAESQGRHVSCTKGCGACCRQLVPTSEVEARRIAELVDAMPEPRRAQVLARFEEAREQLQQTDLWDKLLERDTWDEDVFIEIGSRYFLQGVPCPFLEDESCSIHLDRPITCREYLVTSPAENCATPRKDNIEKVDMPVQVWPALARFMQADKQAKYIRWVPLVMAPQWAASHADDETPRPGPLLLQGFFEQLTGKKAPAPGGGVGSGGPIAGGAPGSMM